MALVWFLLFLFLLAELSSHHHFTSSSPLPVKTFSLFQGCHLKFHLFTQPPLIISFWMRCLPQPLESLRNILYVFSLWNLPFFFFFHHLVTTYVLISFPVLNWKPFWSKDYLFCAQYRGSSINNCWIEYLGKRMLLLSFLFWNQQAQWMSQILCFFLSFCNHTDRPPSVRPSKKQPPPALRLPAQVVTADTVHLRASATDSRAKESDWLQRTDVILQPGLWGSTWKWNGGREW